MATPMPAAERETLLRGFAGFMMMVSGAVTVVQGLWALDHKNAVDQATRQAASQLSYGSLETWGWIMLVFGALAFVASFAIFVAKDWSKWLGITVASVSILLMFFWVFAFPLAAFGTIFMDVLVIWSLFSLGRENRSTA